MTCSGDEQDPLAQFLVGRMEGRLAIVLLALLRDLQMGALHSELSLSHQGYFQVNVVWKDDNVIEVTKWDEKYQKWYQNVFRPTEFSSQPS